MTLKKFFTCLLISSLSILVQAQTIIWSEDFSGYTNGDNNLLHAQPTITEWWTDAGDCDDGGINNDATNYWGVYNGEFRVNDIEGKTCSCGNGGINDNYWYSQSIDVSAYPSFTISMKGRAVGDMECGGSCNAADLLEGYYQLDGGTWVSFFAMCGATDGTVSAGCIQVGNATTLKIMIKSGTQANAETYYFDDIKVIATPEITGSASISTGSTSTLSTTVSGGTWSSSNIAVATVDATGKVTAVANGTCIISYKLPSGCSITKDITVSTPCTTPTISVTNGSRCDAGTVALSASASAGTISWYNYSTSTTSIATGTSYTTPSIAANTTYYVEAANGTCKSTRTTVTATINTTPTISVTAGSRCDVGTVSLSASTSAGTINWYNSSTATTSITTGTSYTTPSIAANTTYYVEATDGSCTTNRTVVIATINAIPTIITTTPASRFGSGTVTLAATASAGTINWYEASTGGISLATGSGFTTPILSNTTTYFVEATNGTCVSTSRTPVTATINALVAEAGTLSPVSCVCSTETKSTTLNATVPSTGTGLWSVISQPVGAPNPDFSNPADANAVITTKKAGQYALRWTVSVNGANASDDVMLDIQDDKTAPVFNNNIPNQKAGLKAGCISTVPDLVELVRNAVTDNCTDNANLQITQLPTAGTQITENTEVTIQVVDLCGNSSDTTILVKANSPFTATLAASSELLPPIGGDVQLEVTIEPEQSDINYIYQWTPAVSTSAIYNGSQSKAQTYQVIVSSSDGLCTSSTNPVTVAVEDIILQTLITPQSANGVNDQFGSTDTHGVNLQEYFPYGFTFNIINRYGQTVAQTENQGWDGKVNGKIADAGVYFYVLQFKDAHGQLNVFKKASIEVVK